MLVNVKCPNIEKKQLKNINWSVKVGTVVTEQSTICVLHLDTEENNFLKHILNQHIYKSEKIKVQCHSSGVVHRLCSIKEVQETGILCEIEQETSDKTNSDSCPHETEFGGICVNCGQILENINLPAKLACGVSARSLKFSETKAATVESNKRAELLKSQKLILVLDLDHTLIHTVQGLIKEPDVFTFEIEGNVFSTRLRPYLSTFLERLYALYEMCVYTMGSHKYAQQIAHIVDPTQKYFGNRIISKDDSDNKSVKSIKMLLPFDDSMALVLDDTNEVWPNCENLVLAERFLYFHNSTDFEQKYIGNNDHYLYFISDLFEKVHSTFYATGLTDVKEILKDLRKHVLEGTRIVLSGVLSSEDNVNKNYYWQTAERFGSQCTREINENTTHIVAQTMGTKKTKLAIKQGIPVLHLLWLHLSISFWTRLPEDYFKFENISNFDIRAILSLPLIRRQSSDYDDVKKKMKNQSADEESSVSDSESDADITE